MVSENKASASIAANMQVQVASMQKQSAGMPLSRGWGLDLPTDIMASDWKNIPRVNCLVALSVSLSLTDGLMRLLQDVGHAYQALAHYDCKRAIQCFSSLPPQHYNTGWVLCQLGRAFFELGEYQEVMVGGTQTLQVFTAGHHLVLQQE